MALPARRRIAGFRHRLGDDAHRRAGHAGAEFRAVAGGGGHRTGRREGAMSARRRGWLRLLAAVGCAGMLAAQAQTEVAFDSLDRRGGQLVTLKAWWFGVDKRQAPAVVLL